MKAVYGTTTACYRKNLLPWELIFVLLTFRDAFDHNWGWWGTHLPPVLQSQC